MFRDDSDFHVLETALAAHDPGDRVSINTVREQLELAQIPPSKYGVLFREAIRHGLIEVVGIDIARHGPANRRLVREYKIAGQKAVRPHNVHPAAAA